MSETEQTSTDTPTPQVLMVDDSKLIRHAGVKILSKEYETIAAEDGVDAWNQIKSNSNISVVFTDLNMPGMTGYDLLNAIRSSDDEAISNLPVIVVTGAEESEEDKVEALENGATDFIRKPFNSTDLRSRAAAHINYRQEIKQLENKLSTDSLTGLLTKPAYQQQGEQALSYALRHKTQLTVVRCDIDEFSTFFVRFGKKVAEKLLSVVSAIIKEEIRKEDYAARTGVANFAFLLLSADNSGAEQVIQRICQRLTALKLKTNNEVLRLQVRAGITQLSNNPDITFELLNNQATEALADAAKQENSDGTVCVSYYHGADDESVDEHGEAVSLDALVAQITDGDNQIDDEKLTQAMIDLMPLLALADQRLILNIHEEIRELKRRFGLINH